MFMLNGSPLPIDTPFEVDGTHYPANWLRLTTIEEKNAIGITEVPDPEPYDDRFYWGVDNPKQLEDITVTPEQGEPYVQKGLKSHWIAWVDNTVWLMLQRTDWMDSRKANDPEFVAPAEWVTWRASIRAQGKSAKQAIAASTDVPSLQQAIAVQWAADPNAEI